MREIKFRAKETKTGEWIYSEQIGRVAFWNMWFQGEFDLETVGQYTGLKDKNGKECYWADWVTDGINPKFLVTSDYHLLARLSEIEFEIVGNKYEA